MKLILSTFALFFVSLMWGFAFATTPVSDGFYKIQCGDSIADGGQLNGNGVVEIRASRVLGKLRLELNISSEEVGTPEAEQHILPTLEVGGTASLTESAFASIDGRPERLLLNLTPNNWSIKERLTAFTIANNNAPKDGDDETSRLIFDGQVYTGVCTIEKK